MAKESRSHMTFATAISGGNTPFSMFDKLSPTASNLGGFEDLVDSSVSTKVNALMTDATNVDEKFAMMEQTIEVLKKSVEDKDLQIAQLMNKLEAYAPGESSHVPPRSPVFTSQKTAVEESFAKLNIQKEKQSTSVAALSVQQLQDMITNTIRAQYGGPSQKSMAVKATSVKVTTKQKVKEDKTPSQYSKEEKRRPTLKELEAKVYPFPDSDVPTILDELLGKKVIDLPESKRLEEIGKVGDPKYCKFHRVISHPTEKCFVLKEKIMALVSEGKIIIDMDETAEANHASIALKEKKCSKLHNVSSTNFLQFGSFEPVEVVLPRKTLEGSLELDNHSKDKDDEGWILVTHKKRKHQAVLRLPLPKPRAKISDVDRLQPPRIIKSCNSALSPKFRKPITLHEFFLGKFFHGSHVEKPSSDDDDDAKSEGENKAQWTTTKVPKKGTEEVSIKISSSKGDIQTKTEEHLVFRYVPRERRKKGQPLLQECTPKKQVSHKDIQHLKEHMTVPVAQIPSVTGESAKGNFQADKIKGHYDPKAFILLEKSGYDFSNPSQLGELKDEVTGTTGKSPSRKILSKHKEQVHEERDHFEVVADKEICSAFPSRMKRKSILSISTDGPLKVQRRTIVYTCQPHKEAKKEKEAMPTTQRSQREKSDFVETSYHITVEDSSCLDIDDEVHEAPPQLEDGGQSTVDELKELNL
ncbi:hypothetical protein A4A49_55384, partial [Nicotiana attenuata]